MYVCMYIYIKVLGIVSRISDMLYAEFIIVYCLVIVIAGETLQWVPCKCGFSFEHHRTKWGMFHGAMFGITRVKLGRWKARTRVNIPLTWMVAGYAVISAFTRQAREFRRQKLRYYGYSSINIGITTRDGLTVPVPNWSGRWFIASGEIVHQTLGCTYVYI
jgi:hypothetical protein